MAANSTAAASQSSWLRAASATSCSRRHGLWLAALSMGARRSPASIW
uniref:Uncharacterized protein n=1 Tax=Macrostomum lignano TaxID=282301 RepID=A0A1I8HNU0_9PLAT